jgi:hypothetical protein
MAHNNKKNDFHNQLIKKGIDIEVLNKNSHNNSFTNPILAYFWGRYSSAMEHERDIGMKGTEDYESTLPTQTKFY